MMNCAKDAAKHLMRAFAQAERFVSELESRKLRAGLRLRGR